MAYKRLSSDPRHSLNSVCPYFTMFPLEYPLGILRRRADARRVLDPFCGRGTTLYAARFLGLESWGTDTSPIAVAIASAKLSRATPTQALSLAREILADKFEEPIPQGTFWRHAFSTVTLANVCRLRAGLARRRSEAASLLRAMALGCLHGPLTKDPQNSSYFSNQMPRTFAPKPDYSVRFWREHGLRPPEASVIDVLSKKAARLDVNSLPAIGGIQRVIEGNAEIVETFSSLPGGFDTVVTSPPYFGMSLYVQDQWLRNWFLGGPDRIDYSRTEQVSHSNPEEFISSLARVWNNVGRAKKQRMPQNLFIRFGSIPSKRVDPREVLTQSLSLSHYPWRVLEIKSAKTAVSGNRQADHMRVDSRSMREYDFHVLLA
jgi:hypothetical protein